MGACKSKQVAAGSSDDSVAEKGGEGEDGSTVSPAVDDDGKKKKKKKKKKLSKAQQEVDAVLGHLQVPSTAVSKFLIFFKKMDDDASGNISLDEFIEFLELDKYYIPFIERCFGAMDFNKKGSSKGALDPTEFTVGLYNLCIMSKDLLEDYVFELYDEVHDGNLYQKQVEKMVSESSELTEEQIKHMVDEVFKALDKDGDGHISKKEFFELDHRTESMLKPMYMMQSCLQKRCLGMNFWDEERSRMRSMLKEYGERTIVDLLANRIAAKYEADRIKTLEERGEKIDEEKKKEQERAKVKGFESDLKGPSKGIKFANDGGAPVFASEIEAKKKERAAHKKAKAKAKAKAKKEAAANGGVVEKKRKSSKHGINAQVTRVSVNVKGANKGSSESWAMKHKDQLAVNQ